MPTYINKQQWIPTEEFPTLVASRGEDHEDTAQRRELAKPELGRWRSLIPVMNVINTIFFFLNFFFKRHVLNSSCASFIPLLWC